MIVQRREAYLHREQHAVQLAAVRARTMMGAQFMLQCCDAALSAEDLNGECAAFAHHYYDKTYLTDFVDALAGDVATPYHVPDTWAAYDTMAPVIEKRFAAWQQKRREPAPKKKRRAKLKPKR